MATFPNVPVRSRRAAACAAAVLLGSAVLYACDDLLVSPKAHPEQRVASLALRMTAGGASLGGGAREAYDKANRLHVRVSHGADALMDTTVALAPAGQDTRVTFDLVPPAENDSVSVAVSLLRDADELFRGVGGTRLRSGQVAPVDVTVHPVAASISVADSIGPLTSVGDTAQLTGQLLFATGDTLPDASFQWTSLDPGIATVVGGTKAVSVANGQARLVASSGALRDTVLVRVRQAVLTLRTPTAADTLLVGDTVTLAAVPVDARGVAVLDVPVTWMSTNLGVLEVSASGVVLARGSGAASVLAMGGGATAEIKVTVQSGSASVVGPAGGVVATAGDTVRLEIPAGALASPVRITIAPEATYPPTDRVLPGGVYHFGPDGTTFAAPAALTIRYDPAHLPAGYPASELRIHKIVDGGWQEVPGSSVDTVAHTVTAAIGGFSGYGVLARVPVASVTVSPDSARVVAGAAVPLSATLKDAAGSVLSGRPVTWTASDSTLAAVDADGRVVTRRDGIVGITATSGRATGHAFIHILPVPAGSVVVTPDSAMLHVGGSVTLSATVRDSSGAPLARTPAWSSSDSTVATVSASGVVTATGEGTATITATSGSASGTARIVVIPVPAASVTVAPDTASVFVGGSVQLAATVRDASGSELPGRAVVWSTSDSAVATVSADGLVTGTGAGTATVTASSGSASGMARVIVRTAPAFSRLVIAPDSAVLTAIGDSVQLTATGYDQYGAPVSSPPVAWSTLDSAVVQVDAVTGLVRAVGAGTALVIGTSAGVADTVTVRVQLAAARVEALPDSAVIHDPGEPVATSATVYDGAGSPVSEPVAWRSLDTGIATVDGGGTIRGVADGTTVVYASAGSGLDSVRVRVQLVARIAVDSVLYTVVGESGRLDPVAIAANGDTIHGRFFTFTSSDTSVLSIDPVTGVGTTRAVGTAIVTSIQGTAGVNGTTRVEVAVPGAVARVLVIPDTVYVTLNQSVQLQARLEDDHGREVTGQGVTWLSGDTLVATVDPGGVVTGVSESDIWIFATAANGVEGLSLVRVRAAPASVQVYPDTATLSVGDSRYLSATPFDAGGNPIDRPVEWSSSDTTILKVDESGNVYARAPGNALAIATADGVSGVATIAVVGGQTTSPVARVVATPDSLVMSALWQYTTLGYHAYDASGNVLPGAQVVWSSPDTALVYVNAQGQVIGHAVGTARVIVRSTTPAPPPSTGYAADTVLVRIYQEPQSIGVFPAGTALLHDPGEAVAASAVVYDYNHFPIPGLAVTWSVTNAAIATVDTAGRIQGVSDGITYVWASYGRLNPASLSVQVQLVTSVQASFTRQSLSVGDSVRLVATAYDGAGNPIYDRTYAFSSSDPSVATVDGAGMIHAVGAGTATIGAAQGTQGIGASATVDVAGTAVAGTPFPVSHLSAGWAHACALQADLTAWCWGSNARGSLGIGSTAGSNYPAPVHGGLKFQAVSAGYLHTCALAYDASGLTSDAWCWGDNTSGATGQGAVGSDVLEPAKVAGGYAWRSVTAGYNITCGVTTTLEGYCWGVNPGGQSGITNGTTQAGPVTPVAGGHRWAQIVTGNSFACGLDDQYAAWCWGVNNGGVLGDASFATSTSTPLAVPGGHTFSKLAAGLYHVCGLDPGGKLWCWGDNGLGQLGQGDVAVHNGPVQVQTTLDVRDVSAAGAHTCLATSLAEMYCWGRNGDGELGTGDNQQLNAPGAAAVATGVAELAAGWYFQCYATSRNLGYCAGNDQYGQLGNGTTSIQGRATYGLIVQQPTGGVTSRVPAARPLSF
jgi:uncharacterized protein YjdB